MSSSPASGEQLVLAVEQRELAAVAGGELPDRERLRLALTAPPPACSGSTTSRRSTGPVLADEQRPELAVAAVPDRALHAALQRQPDRVRRARRAPAARRPRSASSPRGRRSSPRRSPGSKTARGIERGDHADAPAPVGVGARRRSRSTSTSKRAAPAPRARPRRAARRASARRRGRDAAVALAVREQLVDDRPQRREADAAGDHHHVAALGLGQRPGGAERPAHARARRRARRRRAPRSPRRRRARCARAAPSSPMPLTEIGASPDAERVEHRELAGGEARRRPRASAGSRRSVHVSCGLAAACPTTRNGGRQAQPSPARSRRRRAAAAACPAGARRTPPRSSFSRS